MESLVEMEEICNICYFDIIFQLDKDRVLSFEF